MRPEYTEKIFNSIYDSSPHRQNQNENQYLINDQGWWQFGSAVYGAMRRNINPESIWIEWLDFSKNVPEKFRIKSLNTTPFIMDLIIRVYNCIHPNIMFDKHILHRKSFFNRATRRPRLNP